MNTKSLMIIVIVAAVGTMAYGFMSTAIAVDFSNIGFFTSVDMFEGGVECACVDPITGQPPFEKGNCITQAAIDENPSLAPLYIGDVGNMLCTWETNGDEYGGNYLNPEILD